jgi:hypothetical protein
MGVVTDVYFVEGIIDSMKDLDLSGDRFYIREVNCPEDFYEDGYLEMANRIIQKPDSYVLHQNYPNPFNASTSVGYTIPHKGQVRLEMYDQLGRLVEVLVNSYQRESAHLAVWNTKFSASGIFYYRFTFNGFSQTKKMILLR